MKLSIIITIFFVIISKVQITKCDELPSENEVDGMFTCLRYIFKNGLPLLVGPIDPLNVEHYEIDSESNLVFGHYEINQLIMTGLSDFIVGSFSTSNIDDEHILRIKCKLAFHLNITSNYRLDGKVGNVASINGDGNLVMKTSPVQLDLTMDFDSRCENLKCLKKAHADIHMESSVNVTGLKPNARMSSLISRQLTAIINDLFNHNAEIVDAFLDPLLNELIESLTKIEIPSGLEGVVKIYLYFLWMSCSKQFDALSHVLGKQ